MDLRLVPDLTEEEAAKLAAAGVETIEDLRRARPEDLADVAGLDPARAGALVDAARDVRILTDLAGLSPSAARKLADAGAGTPEQLAAADAEDLAARTGLSAALVRRFQSEAAPDVVLEDGAADDDHAPGFSVLLRGDAATVRHGHHAHEDVRILTLREGESVDARLEAVSEDAVILAAGREDAVVRLHGEVYEDVPIYKERVAVGPDGIESTTEIRVRVEAIRERRAAEAPEEAKPRGGLLGRLFGKGA